MKFPVGCNECGFEVVKLWSYSESASCSIYD